MRFKKYSWHFHIKRLYVGIYLERQIAIGISKITHDNLLRIYILMFKIILSIHPKREEN